MDPKTQQVTSKPKRPVAKPPISNYSLIGLVAAIASAIFLHDQLLANSLLGGIDDIITVILINIAPVVAVVMSIIGIRAKTGRSDLSRMIGWVGLIFGLGTLMVSVLFSYSLLSDNSVLGVYDQLFEGII